MVILRKCSRPQRMASKTEYQDHSANFQVSPGLQMPSPLLHQVSKKSLDLKHSACVTTKGKPAGSTKVNYKPQLMINASRMELEYSKTDLQFHRL